MFTHKRSNLKVMLVEDQSLAQNYTRRENNLIYTHSMSLRDALASKPIQIQTLDNRTININLDTAITPQTVHMIPNEGMPIDQPTKLSDLSK